jgi:hypothetical protein
MTFPFRDPVVQWSGILIEQAINNCARCDAPERFRSVINDEEGLDRLENRLFRALNEQTMRVTWRAV